MLLTISKNVIAVCEDSYNFNFKNPNRYIKLI